MLDSTTKSARSADILQLLLVPLMAFLLGRQSLSFTGTPAAWIALVCNMMVLAIALYGAIRLVRSRG